MSTHRFLPSASQTARVPAARALSPLERDRSPSPPPSRFDPSLPIGGREPVTEELFKSMAPGSIIAFRCEGESSEIYWPLALVPNPSPCILAGDLDRAEGSVDLAPHVAVRLFLVLIQMN
jgi:hypothetical protein